MSSDAHELARVRLMMKAGLKHSHNQVVLVKTNSKVTQAYIDHFKGHSIFLSSIA